MPTIPTPPESGVWDAAISLLPKPHLLQTAEWARTKAQVGWKPHYLIWCIQEGKATFHVNQWPSDSTIAAAALVLQRSISLAGFSTRLSVLYAPKGPLLDWNNTNLHGQVITDMQQFSRRLGGIFLKIDPDVLCHENTSPASGPQVLGPGQIVQNTLHSNGWQYSTEQIQFRSTVVIDLTISETDLLDQMKQKTRYNVRLANRKGVTVRPGTHQDYPLLYRMYAETSIRDGFVIRDESYYHNLWRIFEQTGDPSRPVARSLIAEVSGEAVAALIIFMFARRAWYFYGMSRNLHREKMPNYLLQWEAIRLCKTEGCKTYDLWGAPEVLDESDPMWGVYRFKEGLGGKYIRYLGAWDYPVHPIAYKTYSQILPRLLAIMRRRGQAQTQTFVG